MNVDILYTSSCESLKLRVFIMISLVLDFDTIIIIC